MSNNVLVIAPHPDDEVLGCGGIIKKMSNSGLSVYVLIISRGKKELYSEERINNIRNEARKAHAILNVKTTRFLDFPAPELDTVSLADLAVAIKETIIEYCISTVFLPHRGDIHHDHKAVFNAGLVACRPNNGASVREIYSYETLSETEWAAPFSDDSFIPTHFVNIEVEYPFKIEAMKCFKSQLKEFPNSRSLKTIESLSQFRGSTVGFQYAEAFMTIRTIED